MSQARNVKLEQLNRWRNAIVHQSLDPLKLGGSTTLRLRDVQAWRNTCNRLAADFDDVLHAYLQGLTGARPGDGTGTSR